ncbi:LysR substrate-binding domain-containing protein [soil metagenome]
MDLERRHYRLLTQVERLGTISAAAAAVHITQSAASQQLREAERRLGVPLTVRAGRSIELTPAARRLVEGGTTSERLLDAAEADARWLASGQELHLRVALGVYDRVDWVSELMVAPPDGPSPALAELVRCAPWDEDELLRSGKADAYLTVARSAVGGTVTHRLFDDRLVAVIPANHDLADRTSIRASDFVGRRYVTYSYIPEPGFEQETFFRPGGVYPREIVRLESTTAITAAVASGQCLSILSTWAVEDQPGIVTIDLDPPPPRITWSLAARHYAEDHPLRATTQHVVDHLRTRFRR